MKALALALALAASALALPFDLHPPAWIERWLYNPRQRTAAAIDAYQDGRGAEAAELAETALRLATREDAEAAAGEPRLAYNAGTGHLAAGEPEEARRRLEEAVAALEARPGETPALAPLAHYNLGNARFAADDAAAAVEAYKQSLRLDPENPDAKFNLELALRALEEERQGSSSPRESPEGESPGQQEQSDQPGEDEPPSPQQEPQPEPDAGDPAPPEERPEEQPGRQEPAQPEPRLPNFEEQPDMTAAEAAAILEAVENLERQQRRAQALKRAQERQAAGGKDW